MNDVQGRHPTADDPVLVGKVILDHAAFHVITTAFIGVNPVIGDRR